MQVLSSYNKNAMSGHDTYEALVTKTPELKPSPPTYPVPQQEESQTSHN